MNRVSCRLWIVPSNRLWIVVFHRLWNVMWNCKLSVLLQFNWVEAFLQGDYQLCRSHQIFRSVKKSQKQFRSVKKGKKVNIGRYKKQKNQVTTRQGERLDLLQRDINLRPVGEQKALKALKALKVCLCLPCCPNCALCTLSKLCTPWANNTLAKDFCNYARFHICLSDMVSMVKR